MALVHDVLGNEAYADELFARAVQEPEALQSPPCVARTHLDWAEALSARQARRRRSASRCRSHCDLVAAATPHEAALTDGIANSAGDLDQTQSASRS
jgi:hypothetical protein